MKTDIYLGFQQFIDAWNAGVVEKNVDREIARRDRFGNWMRWADFGRFESQFGWKLVRGGNGGMCRERPQFEAVNIHAGGLNGDEN